MFEIIADSDLILSLSQNVSSTSWKESGKSTGEVAFSGKLIDWLPPIEGHASIEGEEVVEVDLTDAVEQIDELPLVRSLSD